MKKDLRILKKLISYCFDTNFFLTILLILGSFILGLFSTIRVWILGKIVNQLSFEFSFLINILPFIIILGITLLMDEALFAFIPYFRRVLIIKIKVRMKKDLIYSINNIPPMIQEINDTQIKIDRAFDFINNNLERSISAILIFISNIVAVISVTILLIYYSWIFPTLAIITAIPIIIIRLKQDAEMHEMYKNQYPDVQLGTYYLNSLTDRKGLLELMLLNAQSLFTNKFLNINKQNIKERTNYFVEHAFKGNLLEAILLMTGNFLSLSWAIFLLFKTASFTIGTLSIVINGILNAQNDVIAFAFNGKYLYEAILFGEDYWEICETYENNYSDYKFFDEIYSIELKDLYFKYPNTNSYALKNINLKLKINETLGVTGVNGSGKSTLCKVILGVYKPTKGEIFINGENVTDVNYIFQDSGVVFQDFVKYELTPGDNIYFGSTKKGKNQNEIIQAAKKSGAHDFINKLADKYDTPIGTLLKNSTYLSGGQWQRLAIARGFYANGNFLVLDEPNASMDPRMEDTLFREYQEVINKKECIGFLISHRLGSTKDCDKIIVMEDGEIVEEDTYEELMKLGGKYSQMYNAQSKLYKEESV